MKIQDFQEVYKPIKRKSGLCILIIVLCAAIQGCRITKLEMPRFFEKHQKEKGPDHVNFTTPTKTFLLIDTCILIF